MAKLYLHLVVAIHFFAIVVLCDTATKYCSSACSVLQKALPGQVATKRNTISYQQSKAGYYTTFNSELNPACFTFPDTAQDVAIVVKTARIFRCPFAVKSGSHTFFAGSSNIQDGMTIDLKGLNEIIPNKYRPGTVGVGPGNRWGQVYDRLDPLNITVLGGRVADVGVGGLLLSGGISFFQPRLGLDCDSVSNYQVVDANGQLLEVNQDSFPDMYWALRGGGSNFGIVTRFDLDAIQHGKLWGGLVTYNISQLDVLVPAFAQLAEGNDLKATTWLVLYYQPKLDSWIISTHPTYTDPVPLHSPPKIFAPFLEAPHLTSDIRIDHMASFTRAIDSSIMSTQAEWVITQKFNTDVIYYLIDKIKQWDGIKDTLILGVAIDLQVLSSQALSLTSKKGGNPLGLSGEDGPLLIMHLQLRWMANATAADVMAYYAKGGSIIADVEKWGKNRSLQSRYIYQNYAGPDQDVYGGYGAQNLQKLRQVAKKYDPEGVFQKLMPGGLKLY